MHPNATSSDGASSEEKLWHSCSEVWWSCRITAECWCTQV